MLRFSHLVGAGVVALVLTQLPAAAEATTSGQAHVLTTVKVPGGASIVTANPATGKVYVGNGNDSRVTGIDSGANEVTGKAHGGCCGQYGLAVNPATDTIYAAGIDDNLYAINKRTNKRTKIDVASRDDGLGVPFAVAVNSATNLVYVTSLDDNIVTVVDGRTNTVTTTFPLPDQPLALEADPLTNRIYFVGGSSLWVLNGQNNHVTATVAIGRAAGDLALDNATHRAYVTSADDNTVTVVDTSTNHVTGRVHVGAAAGGALLAVAADPSSNRVYVASYDDQVVVVINGATNHVAYKIQVSSHPVDLAVVPSTGGVYVVDGTSSVTVIGS